jgi:RNA-directed DNA polymerase
VRALLPRIAREEGFRVHERKSQLMSSGGRQRLCGIVVNERPNVTRAEYDRLKAILHNAARHGPAGENRAGVPDFRAHLLGRIA